MRITAEERRAKLAKLIEIEGFSSIEELVQAVLSDTVSPAVCMNDGCDFTCEMEPDQDADYCEECHTNSMQSALILADHLMRRALCLNPATHVCGAYPTRSGLRLKVLVELGRSPNESNFLRNSDVVSLGRRPEPMSLCRSYNSAHRTHLSAIRCHVTLFSGLGVNFAMSSHSAANFRNRSRAHW